MAAARLSTGPDAADQIGLVQAAASQEQAAQSRKPTTSPAAPAPGLEQAAVGMDGQQAAAIQGSRLELGDMLDGGSEMGRPKGDGSFMQTTIMAAANIKEMKLTPKRASPRLAKNAGTDSMSKAKKRAAWTVVQVTHLTSPLFNFFLSIFRLTFQILMLVRAATLVRFPNQFLY